MTPRPRRAMPRMSMKFEDMGRPRVTVELEYRRGGVKRKPRLLRAAALDCGD